MTVVIPFRRSSKRPVWWVALALLIAGCGSSEEIRSYTVPKEVAASPAEATHRMLAAILPAGGQAWFFKVVGPTAEIDKRADELTKFFTSVRSAESGPPKWELPADWKEQGPTEFRAATILVPSADKPLEISVTTLPWSGAPRDLLANVNRWRGQMQLPPIGIGQIAESTREMKAGDAPMTLVDLRGNFAGGPMTAPFAGGRAAAPTTAAPARKADLPAGHPPIDEADNPERAGATAPPVADDVPKFEAPASWKPAPTSQFRKAAFDVTDGKQKALVTVIDFRLDSGAMIADPLPNVNRWRGEVGLPPIEKNALESVTEAMEIGGQPSKYVRSMPDPAKAEQSQIAKATLAAMVTSGDRIWFFKMTGDRDWVAAHENEFKTFLKSVRFAADAGAPDGNK